MSVHSIFGGVDYCCKAYVPSTKEEAQLLLRLALNCADIGHLSLGWVSHVKWVNRLQELGLAQLVRQQ
eukprot:6475065-Amphidinium_carterae.1